MSCITNWLEENELIINLKKGKTESLIFGTAKRRAKDCGPFKVHSEQKYWRQLLIDTWEWKLIALLI